MDSRVAGVLLQQVTSLLVGRPRDIARLIINPEIGLPGKYRDLSAYNVRQWLDKQDSRPIPTFEPEEPVEPVTQSEKERVKELTQALSEHLKASTNMWNKRWPRIGGNPVPPNLVKCDDGKLRPPIGKYAKCEKAF